MFEHRTEPVLSKSQFLRRVGLAFLITLGLVIISIALGTMGLWVTEDLDWEASFLRACLILAEHDVDHHPKSTSGIIFFGIFVLYARLVFVSLIAILLAPIAHRISHRLHFTLEGDDDAT